METKNNKEIVSRDQTSRAEAGGQMVTKHSGIDPSKIFENMHVTLRPIDADGTDGVTAGHRTSGQGEPIRETPLVAAGLHQQNNQSAERPMIYPLMPKVPTYIQEKYNSEDYVPLVASFGPYYGAIHNNPANQRLMFVEKFKPKALEWFVRGTGSDENSWLEHVRGMSTRISSYFITISGLLGLSMPTSEVSREDRTEEERSVLFKDYYAMHSVTELKAKGIYVEPNQTNSFKNITFKSGWLNGTLQLPVDYVNYSTRAAYSNIIAYEMSPGNHSQDYTMTAYVHLMKSLLQTPMDVEELQANGTIVNMLGSDLEVIDLYREIYTFGTNCSSRYGEICQKMVEHYNNKTKTCLSLYSFSSPLLNYSPLLDSLLFFN
ncbi:hypothetical protein Leryth_025062 [Lithospermum erythrorhizon]|nr:hypothetical protein Leryth_025062 [Lithospermum erythrorhizon]